MFKGLITSMFEDITDQRLVLPKPPEQEMAQATRVSPRVAERDSDILTDMASPYGETDTVVGDKYHSASPELRQGLRKLGEALHELAITSNGEIRRRDLVERMRKMLGSDTNFYFEQMASPLRDVLRQGDFNHLSPQVKDAIEEALTPLAV